jgi:hypothetical protein
METTVSPYLTTTETKPDPGTQTIEEIRARIEQLELELQQREDNNTPLWLGIIDDLAHGDRTKWDFFFDMPVVEFLNTYSFNLARKKELGEQLDTAANLGPHASIQRALNQILFTR